MLHRWFQLIYAISTLPHTYPMILGGGLSFSQFGEDLLVSRIGSIPRDSFFVDIGAAYPVKHSNTFRFYLRGGSGITVEPNPDLASQHRSIRPRDTCVSAGISTYDGNMKYYRFEIVDYNTFDAETAEKVQLKGVRLLDVLDVPTLPLASLLESHVGERTIDFMSIDCEGLDLDVVRSSDWLKFRPRILAIEDHEWTFEAQPGSQIAQYLYNVGYRLAARLSYSSIYVRNE